MNHLISTVMEPDCRDYYFMDFYAFIEIRRCKNANRVLNMRKCMKY